MRFLAFVLGALPLSLALGCGGAPPPKSTTPATAKADHDAEATKQPVPDGHLARADVDAVLEQGPPWLLSQVEIEEVIDGGKFVGWRLLGFPATWTVELRRGDVIKSVNGVQIERPDDLWKAWTSVAEADAIAILYEREGQPFELRLPISGDPSAETRAALEQPRPGGAPADQLGINHTIVISGE